MSEHTDTPAPADDEQLHSLNQQLKRLEQEARQP